MSLSKTTSRDRSMFALAIVPLIALGAIFTIAGASWRSNRAEIRPMLLKSFSPELIDAPSPMAADYDARTSAKQTDSVRELFFATSAVNGKYHSLINILDDQEDWFDNLDQERPIDQYIRDYLAEAEPLLELLNELQPNLNSVWFPNEFNNPGGWYSSAGNSDGLVKLLQIEYTAAVREQNADRAIRAVRLRRGLDIYFDFYQKPLLPVVVQSMTIPIWTAGDLKQMDQLLTEDRDPKQAWSELIRFRQLGQVPWLLHGKVVSFNYSRGPVPITYAPSRRIDWLKRCQNFSSLRAAGSLHSFDQIDEINRISLRSEDSSLDVAVQFPVYGQFYSGVSQSMWYVAMSIAKDANQRRHARTTVAIAAYKVKFDSYPESLDDLSQVGLAQDETLDVIGRPFLYHKDDDGCELSNASMWFVHRTGPGNRWSNNEDKLSSILDKYEVVKFR